jgi:two-component system NtrC family sensor kinase
MIYHLFHILTQYFPVLNSSINETSVSPHQLTQMGRLTNSILHEISNPLSTATCNLEWVMKNQSSNQLVIKEESAMYEGYEGDLHPTSTVEERLNLTLQCLRHVEKILKNSQSSVSPPIQNEFFCANEKLKMTLQLFAEKAWSLRIFFCLEENEEVWLFGNPTKFTQMCMNLLANSMDAYEEKTPREKRKILVSLKRTQKEVLFRVQDWGMGIPPKNLCKIFFPFYTTKTPDKGTGLGLYIIKNFIEEDFGGTIEVESKVNVGTIFTVQLPIKNPQLKKVT